MADLTKTKERIRRKANAESARRIDLAHEELDRQIADLLDGDRQYGTASLEVVVREGQVSLIKSHPAWQFA